MANNIIDSFLILFTTQVRGNGIQQLNKQTAGVMKNMSGAGNMLKMFFGYDLYTTVRQLIPSLIDTSKQIGAMESRFNAVSTSARAGAEELKWVGEQSKQLGLNFLQTADNYSIFFATVSKNMGGGQTREVFQQWAQAFRVLHIDPERQGRVLYALREMSSKGKIYMQDLALQLGSAVPDAMNIAAKSMGYVGPKAVERFRQAIKDGAIDVKKFIPMFSKAVNEQYVSAQALEYAMTKPDAQIQLLTTHWQMFQMAIAKGGFEKDLVSVLKSLNFLLGGLEKHGEGLYKTLRGIAQFVGIIFGGALLGKGVGLLKSLGGFMRMANSSKLIQIGMQFRGLLATLSKYKWLVWLVTGLGELLSGPAGWIILITTLLGFILHKFFPNVEKYLWTMLNRLILFLWNSWYALKADFDKSPFGKWVNEKYATSGVDKALMEEGGIWKGDKKAKTEYDNNIAYETIAGKNDPLRRVLNMLTGGQLDKALNKTSYTKPQNNKMDVKIIFESKGEIPEEQVSALKNTIGTTFMNAVDVIINSKNNLSQPIKYTGTRPVANPV